MKKYLCLAALLGLTAVGLGAFGAHALKNTLLANNHVQTWQTAVLYQFIHASSLLALSLNTLSTSPSSPKWYRAACCSWVLGTVLFSGSLYWLALNGPRWLGPVTPSGGIILILGWLFLLVGALKFQPNKDKS